MTEVENTKDAGSGKRKTELSIWAILGRITVVSGQLMCFITVVGMFLFFIPKMEAQFTEMLAGQPLPALTRWILTFRMLPIILSFLILGFSATVLALGAHVPKSVAWLNTLTLFLHCLLIGITILGLYLPYVKLIEQVGSY